MDQVVGYSYLPAVGEMPLQQVAFLWSRDGYGVGKMINLNKLLNETGKNYLLISATAINDNGQIVANAWDIHERRSTRRFANASEVIAMTVVVTNKMKTGQTASLGTPQVGERRCGGRPEGDSKCRRKYVAGALECETDEQIASNLLEGQIRHQPQILDLPSRNQV